MSMIWSISSLVNYVKRSLDGDPLLTNILIKGEISNFTHHRSGHLYFTLKDDKARISCVMFATYARNVKFQIKDGCKVIVKASLSMYEASGSVQLYVNAMQLDGIGDLYLELERLKKKLASEGLFDTSHKKALPHYPMNIAFISAKTGAATQDVLITLKRRWPLAKITFYPSLVQGEQASENLIQMCQKADENGHDVVLLVRGGGSIEDLWCFNSESLARTIYAMKTPIITGVGHETDTTLVDYVSDMRAATPTAAAQLAVPDMEEVKQLLYKNKKTLQAYMSDKMNQSVQKLNQIKKHRYYADPLSYAASYRMQIEWNTTRMMHVAERSSLKEKQLKEYKNQMIHQARWIKQKIQVKLDAQNVALLHRVKEDLEKEKQRFIRNVALCDAYSPLKIVQRGYSLTYSHHQLIKSIADVEEEDVLETHVADGIVISQVIAKEEK